MTAVSFSSSTSLYVGGSISVVAGEALTGNGGNIDIASGWSKSTSSGSFTFKTPNAGSAGGVGGGFILSSGSSSAGPSGGFQLSTGNGNSGGFGFTTGTKNAKRKQYMKLLQSYVSHIKENDNISLLINEFKLRI